MTINSSGPLSLGGLDYGISIGLESGNTGSAFSINDTIARSLANLTTPNSQISFNNFYSKTGNFNSFQFYFGSDFRLANAANLTNGNILLVLNSGSLEPNSSTGCGLLICNLAGVIYKSKRIPSFYGTGVSVSLTGDIYVAGFEVATPSTTSAAVLVKISSDIDTVVWTRRFSKTWYQSGGPGYTEKIGPFVDSSGNIYVCVPYRLNDSSSFPLYFGTMIIKLDSSGNMLYKKVCDPIGFAVKNSFLNLNLNNDTYFDIVAEGIGMRVLSASGAISTAYSSINTGSLVYTVQATVNDNSGNYFVLGRADNGLAIVRLNSSNTISWGKTYVFTPSTFSAWAGRFNFVFSGSGFLYVGARILIQVAGVGYYLISIALKINPSTGDLVWARELSRSPAPVSFGSYDVGLTEILVNNSKILYSMITQQSFYTYSGLRVPELGTGTNVYGSYSISYADCASNISVSTVTPTISFFSRTSQDSDVTTTSPTYSTVTYGVSQTNTAFL